MRIILWSNQSLTLNHDSSNAFKSCTIHESTDKVPNQKPEPPPSFHPHL